MLLKTSSYEKNNFSYQFKKIIKKVKPTFIIEFGIGNGYSLNSLVKYSSNDCEVYAFDLFDDYQYNRPDEKKIMEKFSDGRVLVAKGDFYKMPDDIEDNSVDIIHVDISNDGDVFQFAVENYISKLTDNGVLVLEGGSMERDKVEWMVKYNKRKIFPYLLSIMDKFSVKIINCFPSMTIIKK